MNRFMEDLELDIRKDIRQGKVKAHTLSTEHTYPVDFEFLALSFLENSDCGQLEFMWVTMDSNTDQFKQ